MVMGGKTIREVKERLEVIRDDAQDLMVALDEGRVELHKAIRKLVELFGELDEVIEELENYDPSDDLDRYDLDELCNRECGCSDGEVRCV